MPDYRTMEAVDWAVLAGIIAVCLFIAYILAFRPMIPWRSTQRWRAPGQKEEDLGEPTKSFRSTCRVFAVAVLILGALCVIQPFMPLIRGS